MIYAGCLLDPQAPPGGDTAADKQKRLRAALAALEAGAPRAENAFELAYRDEVPMAPHASWEPDGTGELGYETEVCGCGDGGRYAWTVTKAANGPPSAADRRTRTRRARRARRWARGRRPRVIAIDRGSAEP